MTHKQLTTISNIILIISLVIGMFLYTLTVTHAQVAPDVPRMTSGEVSVDFSPEYPDAFSTVEVELITFSIDLDLHFVTWYVNGESYDRGYGKKMIRVSTGDYGETTSVRADIELQNGNTVTKNISVRPNVVDVLWEALDAYTPPFYRGKALPTRGGMIKFSALPYVINNNQSLRSTQFSYTWEWEYKTIGERSGFAKDYFIIETNLIRNREIVGVEARTTSGNYSAKKFVRVPLVDPELMLFDESSTPRQPVTGTYVTESDQLNLKLEPYFFATSRDGTPNNLLYTWKINDQEITPPNVPYRLPISVALRGRVQPRITVRHPKFFSTEVTKTFDINVIE